MTREERFEHIEQYLRHELGGEQIKAFEAALDEDPTLRRELDRHREIHEALGDRKREQFAVLLREREQAYFDGLRQGPLHFLRRHRRAAAAVVLLLAGSLAFWLLQGPADPAALFTAYYEPYPAPGNFRSEDLTDLDDNFLLGLARYDEAQYAEAAQYFSRTLAADPGKDLAVFLRGLSYLAAGEAQAAGADLQAVINDEGSLFREQARWYLTLLYLKQGDREAAREALRPMQRDARAEELWRVLE